MEGWGKPKLIHTPSPFAGNQQEVNLLQAKKTTHGDKNMGVPTRTTRPG
jgi:hypothetical protein